MRRRSSGRRSLLQLPKLSLLKIWMENVVSFSCHDRFFFLRFSVLAVYIADVIKNNPALRTYHWIPPLNLWSFWIHHCQWVFSEQRGRVCDPTCDPAQGCWGRGPTMCTKCRYWQLNDTCVRECPKEGWVLGIPKNQRGLANVGDSIGCGLACTRRTTWSIDDEINGM